MAAVAEAVARAVAAGRVLPTAENESENEEVRG